MKNGALLLGDEKLGGVNQLPNTSGLVMLGGSVVVTGAQRFGALFGTAGSTLDMGANDLTIGVTDARLAQIRASVGALTSPNNSYYLATDGSTVVSGYTGQTTRDFLQSVGMSAADAATMAFAGSITGSGRLIKEGAERLILTGVNTYTGATVINGGTLQVNVGSIDSSSSVTVAAGANFAVNVDSGSGEFNRVVQGAGNFEKTGAGTLTLGQDVYQYSGTTTVSGGTLVVTLNPAMTGAILIAPGATLAANQPLDTTFGTSIVSTVTGNGTFQKDGGGLLYLTNFTGFTGLARVNEGILRVDTLSPTSVEVGLGATFLLTPTAAVPAYTGSVSGAGTFAVRGQSIAFGASNAGFTGTLSGENTTIVASVDDIFPLATVSLVNSVFSIDGTVQHLARFTGDVVSSVNLGTTGSLHFAPGEGVDAAFGGIINGTGGSIVKDGTGTQRLTTPLNTGWTGRTIVNEGTLVATVDALGNSALTINAGTNLSALGTLSFLNEDSDNPATYAGVIAGDGVIGKTGVGVVNLTNVSAAFSGSIAVTQGELHVSSSGIGGKLFGDTSVATGGIYAVALPGDTAHDSSVAGNRVSDMITPDGVAQHGSLAVEGPFVFRLLNGQSYTGNTILRQGVTLDLVNSTGLNGVLAGLAGESGTTVRTDGAALTIVQSVDGVFSGAFNTTTDLTVKGAGKLAMDNISNNIGTITVDGGRLALDASLGNTVNLVNGGTLYFDTTNFNQVYAGPVVGDGNMLKTGEGTLSLLNSTDFANLLGFDGGLGSDQGRLEVSVAALLSTAPNVTKLISEGKGEVALQVGAGETQSLTMAMTGDGSYFKTGDGKLVLGTAANPYTIDATGTFTIERGVVGGYFSTSGDLVVGPDGTLAPGNSPGTVTVNGNFTSYGTLALELNATTSDKIVVNGAATLAAGTKFLVTQDNTPGSTAPVRGKAYQVITATGGIFAQEGDFTVDLSNPANRRVIILTPGRYNTLFAYNPNIPHDANSVYIYDAPSLAGFSPHDGLSGFVGRLDDYIVGRLDGTNVALGLPSNALGGALAFAPESSLAQTINNLSPLGYASLYTMSRDTALRQEDRLKERLEQRRYDNGGYSWADWEAFVVGAAGMADNRTAADTPVFDYKTYGGMVGLDKKIEDGLFVGGAAGYDNGTASLHQDGGKIDMNRVRGTAFMSTMVTKRWFVDGGLSAGFGDFSSKRNTALGRVTGSTTGFDLGLNVSTGTVLVLREDLHLTPFVGVSYAHHEFQGFTEKGADSVLKLDGWSQDSLRTSLGTGLGWWVPSGDWKWKFGVDVAYNHELLDTDSDIDASFARLGGGKFGTTAAALPSDTVSFSPNVALNFDEETSVSAGVTFEYGFDGRTYGGINVAFRRRF